MQRSDSVESNREALHWTGGFVPPPANWRQRLPPADQPSTQSPAPSFVSHVHWRPWHEDISPEWELGSALTHSPPATKVELLTSLAAIHGNFGRTLKALRDGKDEEAQLAASDLEATVVHLQQQLQSKRQQVIRMQLVTTMHRQVLEKRAILEGLRRERMKVLGLLEGGEDSSMVSEGASSLPK